MATQPFERVFAPRAVAVIGAGDGSPAGARVLVNLVAGGFTGPIHAVGDGVGAPAGTRQASSLLEIEGPVDLAIVATRPGERLAAVRACAERGVAGAVLLRGAQDGDAPMPELLDAARSSGMRLFGPESIGLIRPGSNLQASLTSGGATAGSLALVSQSAAICAAVLDWAAAHRIGFSTVVSLGHAADVDLGEMLEYLALDPATRSVLLHVERVRSARAFLTGLRIAARIKPVIVVRAGRHGGAGSSSDDAFDAALARAGAVRVPHIAQMFAAARLLSRCQAVAGNRLAILANARGPGLLAADRAADLGVAVPPLAAATLERLAPLLPPGQTPSNPLDLSHDADPARYRAAVEACLADPETDAVLAMLVPQAFSDPAGAAEVLATAGARSRKPIIACWMGEESVRRARTILEECGIPELSTPERAVEAFDQLASYGRNQRLLRQVPEPLAPGAMPQAELARDLVCGALAKGRSNLTTAELRKLLATLGVRDRAAAGSRVSGTELSVAVERDAVFGPVLRFGRGGAAGPVGDRVVALPPLNTAIIQTLTRTSRIAGLFTEAGGMSSAEVTAFERTLWAISELVSEVPELVGLEICPLVAVGDEVYASGATAAIAPLPAGAGRHDHMAIHPYPSELRTRWQLADGTALTVRPIRPEDAELEASFVRNLSDNARHFRFMVGLKELPREMLIRFTQIDYDRELALVAMVERGGQETEIAVARYAMTAPKVANVAIVVADEWQGRGIGRRLFSQLIETARARGIELLDGEILAENEGARKLVTGLGFKLRRDPESTELLLIEKRLA